METVFVEALCKEIREFPGKKENAETIYFGGGTPSLLSPKSIEMIMEALHKRFTVPRDTEISLEANPEDICKENLHAWKSMGFNRLSIGIQSLNDELLTFLGRKHSKAQNIQCLEATQQAGFDNISADLIYGVPGMSQEVWEHDLRTVLSSGIHHLSAYHLTIETGTLLHRQLKQGHFSLPDDETSYRQFIRLFEITEQEGFPWYEISNFAKPDFHSRHNSSYWKGTAYYGFGPSAHSYDGNNKRWWNESDLSSYINPVQNQSNHEILSKKDKINDYLITHLRTRRGVDLKEMANRFPDLTIIQLKRKLDVYTTEGKAVLSGNLFSLRPESLFISDSILKDILYI